MSGGIAVRSNGLAGSSHIHRSIMRQPIDHPAADRADNLVHQAARSRSRDEYFVVLVHFGRLFLKCEKMFAREIARKNGLSRNGGAINMHVEQAQENADTHAICLQVIVFSQFGYGYHCSIGTGYNC